MYKVYLFPYISKSLCPKAEKGKTSNYSIIGVTLNTKLDTLWLSQVGGPMEGLTKKYDTSPES